MPSSVTEFFSRSYREAREKFLAAAETAGLDVHSHRHPLLGRDGEVLAMDVARFGAADARRLLVLTSACHGVEGYCGSGVQIALLSDPAFHRAADAAGAAVLYIHALNPYGFSWWRRTTHENVDLNRNFIDFSRPPPTNPGYEEIAHALVPPQWPPTPENEAVLMRFLAQHGEKALQQAISGGQYTHPQGLFYGGANPTWSHQTLRHVLQEHGQRCERLGWIDFHTGLGPTGVGERIFACQDDAQAWARAQQWWGPAVTSIHDGSSSSAQLEGLMWMAAYQECPQAEYTGIALEYGTVPLRETIEAMRGDQWLENHPEVGAPQAQAIKQRLLAAFYTDTDAWRAAIVQQGTEAALQACAGLGA
ncbi:M14 family metallopeptidase [Ideonella sp. BN130291]|uniref:M14 family metallopeptidase n=1 Tax=Ideonella sp. BN130291 TaxID=3112940 RepID=UPI002E275C81|nr:M14 family metallopeptidase [Ideonella sp. BN130291]